jgi:xanthine dehydrogenase accessory factor
MSGDDLLGLVYDLARRREPFALATVVRCERPTSAKPGAKALIRSDGSMTGWIGGSCAEPLAVREALEALRDGQPRLIALVGEGGEPDRREGVREYTMSCHSGGTLEIFIEPVLPKPQLVLVGSGPVVETLAALGRAVSFDAVVVAGPEDLWPVSITAETAVVVATHGRFDEDALEQALQSRARYVSLVASPKRARALVETLRGRGVPLEALERLKAPAGLDLGAVTPEEIAVSILAEIVRARRAWADARAEAPVEEPTAAGTARDPICGMTVAVAGAPPTSEVAGQRFYFCGAGCKERFDRNPTPYAVGTRD